MLGPELELNIAIPEQTLDSLTFAENTPEAIAKWKNQLPMANIGETARQLYMAIRELNILSMSPAERFQALESLRQAIHFVCGELSKHFLNRSITPQERQRKIINLVQTLRFQLAMGYKIVLMTSIPRMGNELIRKNFGAASHRVITEYGSLLLLCDQLYMHAPKTIWQEMHEVYRFCETLGLLRQAVKDEHFELAQETRIDQAYRRNLLLACCRPNQLRQTDINTAYQVFGAWAEYTEFGSGNLNNAVFCVNFQDDAPPRHKSLSHAALSEHYYGFETAELVTRLTNYISASDEASDKNVHLPHADKLSNSLLRHLSHAFGILTKRIFKRMASNGHLELAVGISSCHYHHASKTSFQKLLIGDQLFDAEQEDSFISAAQKKQDTWSQSFDAESVMGAQSSTDDTAIDFGIDKDNSEDKKFPTYKVGLVNTSPGGYCIQWNDELPSNVQAGELLCVREIPSKTWSVAVIRWIRHSKQKGTQLGIELFAPNAQSVAVQQLQRTGSHSEFMRGLLLPEITAVAQPATLITPRMPFQMGNKVMIRHNGMESKCMLEEIISETASFTQFTMNGSNSFDSKSLKYQTNKKNQFSKEDEFDSLWQDL
jgi:hypothetical protein